jgi:hypothetical protein
MKGRFDRHQNMNAETRSAIMNVTSNLGYEGEEGELHNYLCGFFDGYDYSDDIMELFYFQDLERTDFDLFLKITGLCTIVTNYPKIKE